MPLPTNFSRWEHLQNTLLTVYNRQVIQHFYKTPAEDISTAKGSLREACTIRDDDSAILCILRMLLFFIVLRKAQDLHPPIYGQPKSSFDAVAEYQPQVRLYFSQIPSEVKEGYSPIDSEISFRVHGATTETINEGKARQLAIKIREAFTSANKGLKWNRGNLKVTYKDLEKGYNFSILCRDEAEARRLITATMSVQNHSPDWNRLTLHDPKRPSESISAPRRIYGRSVKSPRYRPPATLRFRYAELKIHGLNRDITLIDLTGRRLPLIKLAVAREV